MFRFVQIIYSNLILQIFQLTIAAEAIRIIVQNLFEHKNIFLLELEIRKLKLGAFSKEARKLSFKSIVILDYCSKK